MATSMWAKAVQAVRDYIVLIETPSARGTGFVVPPPPGSKDACVVTAWHVIEHAEQWHEPIKLTHFPSGKQAFLDTNSRVIQAAQGRDQAIIMFPINALPLPSVSLPLLNQVDIHFNEGVEIGWLGYPAVAPFSLCFFCGHISTWLNPDEAYLVDGVAINGVSGGPAFIQDDKDNPTVIGLITEYRPNFATGSLLPGVSLVRSINPLLKHYTEIQKQLDTPKVQDIPTDEKQRGLPTSLS